MPHLLTVNRLVFGAKSMLGFRDPLHLGLRGLAGVVRAERKMWRIAASGVSRLNQDCVGNGASCASAPRAHAGPVDPANDSRRRDTREGTKRGAGLLADSPPFVK